LSVNTLTRPPKHLSTPARRLWRETVEGYELERHHLELLERAARTSFARLLREIDLEGVAAADPRIPRR
jgi:hypothetical protein